MKSCKYIAVTLVLGFLYADPAHAGFFKKLEKAVQNLGKAGGDVVTLGEAGRRRDRARARKREQEIKLKREKAEALKKQKIGHLEDLLKWLDSILVLQRTNSELSTIITQLQDDVLRRSQAILAERSRTKRAVELVRDELRKDSSDISKLINDLKDSDIFINVELSNDQPIVIGGKSSKPISDRVKRIQEAQVSRNKIYAAFLGEALSDLKSEKLELIIKVAAKSASANKVLQQKIFADINELTKIIDGKKAELVALKAKPATPPAATKIPRRSYVGTFCGRSRRIYRTINCIEP